MRRSVNTLKNQFAGCITVLVLGLLLAPAAAQSPGSAPAGTLEVIVFYSPTCSGCREFEAGLKALEERWQGRISIHRRHLSSQDAFRDLLLYEKHYSVGNDDVPVAFVGSRWITGLKPIVEQIDPIIRSELAAGSATFVLTQAPASGPAERQPEAPPEILAKFSQLQGSAVALAGLVDGVNPCAFTTIVFLLSMLAYLGKSKRQLLMVGAGFATAVFATYLLLGLGLMQAIKVFSVQSGIAKGLTYAVAALAFVLAGWSVIDFIRYRRSGDAKAMTLGLPASIKQRVHKVIRVGLNTRALLVGALGVGFLVAILESICTGQLYLPTIVFVARSSALKANAFGYLLLYNFMFILPLLGVIAVAYMGVKSDRFAKLLQAHLGLLKIGMAVLFAGLGAMLLWTI